MEEAKCRTVDELVNVPKAEMTEEELNLWIEYQMSIAARDAAYEERNRVMTAYLESIAKVHGENAERIMDYLRDYVRED